MDKNGIAPRFLHAGYMTTKDWTAQNHVTAPTFLAAIRETAQWANANRAAADVLAKPFPAAELFNK